MSWEKISKTEQRCLCRIERCEKSDIQELSVREDTRKHHSEQNKIEMEKISKLIPRTQIPSFSGALNVWVEGLEAIERKVNWAYIIYNYLKGLIM